MVCICFAFMKIFLFLMFVLLFFFFFRTLFLFFIRPTQFTLSNMYFVSISLLFITFFFKLPKWFTGHVLGEIGKKHSSNWVNDLRTRYGTPTGKERLYDLLFTFREMRNVRDKSFLLSDCGFSNMAATAVPSKAELAEYDACKFIPFCWFRAWSKICHFKTLSLFS